MKIKVLKEYLPLASVILLAVVLRFWRLGSVPVMGDDLWSLRLFGASAGVVTILLTFQIARFLFRHSGLDPESDQLSKVQRSILKQVQDDDAATSNDNYYKLLPLISAFFLAISPWHIHFSRSQLLPNLILTFTLCGVYLLSLFFKRSKNVFLYIIIFVIGFSYLANTMSFPLPSGREVISHWFNYFSGRFLFFEGDWMRSQYRFPYHGVLTVADLFLFIPGLYILIRNFKQKAFMFLGLWLMLSPLPAVLSHDQINAVLSYSMVIPLTVVLALGATVLFKYGKSITNALARNTYYLLLTTCYLLSYLYFLDIYFVHLPIHFL